MGDAMTPKHRLAVRFAKWAGDGARAAELRGHLHDLDESSAGISTRDVGSVAALAVNHQFERAIRDLPWWLAGLPFAFLLLIAFSFAYETHFFAWDMIERTPDTTEARIGKRVVDGLVLAGVLFGLLAGRRAVEHVRHGRITPVLLLFVAIIAAGSQLDLFTERTPDVRDGGLLERHINEVPYYSVGLFAAIALVPMLFVVADMMWSRQQRKKGAGPSVGLDERSNRSRPGP